MGMPDVTRRSNMDVEIRPLRLGDISQVAQIERQAFPTLWPPTPFKREMENRRAKYLIAWDPRRRAVLQSDPERPVGMAGAPAGGLLGRLLGGLKGYLSPGGHEDPNSSEDLSVVGFLGLWFMSDEAHITSIAVSESWRGKGVGELLLLGSLELAMCREASAVSLEARVSNHVAQTLYLKYGFEKVGIRKAYYTDNREDATIMTTRPINAAEYQAKFRDLKQAYQRRYGVTTIELCEGSAVDPPNRGW